MQQYKTMLMSITTMPIVSRPRKRYGTSWPFSIQIKAAIHWGIGEDIYIFNIVNINQYVIPKYSTFANPPVAIVKVKNAQVKCRILSFQGSSNGQSSDGSEVSTASLKPLVAFIPLVFAPVAVASWRLFFEPVVC